uniref:Uncharacterized protein n=1 Tax=Heterorhabditis bacteriophora TaxID=37862 RepID=A0A1I7X9T4_HETBA
MSAVIVACVPIPWGWLPPKHPLNRSVVCRTTLGQNNHCGYHFFNRNDLSIRLLSIFFSIFTMAKSNFGYAISFILLLFIYLFFTILNNIAEFYLRLAVHLLHTLFLHHAKSILLLVFKRHDPIIAVDGLRMSDKVVEYIDEPHYDEDEDISKV